MMLPSRSGEKGDCGKKTGGYSLSEKVIKKRLIFSCLWDTRTWNSMVIDIFVMMSTHTELVLLKNSVCAGLKWKQIYDVI